MGHQLGMHVCFRRRAPICIYIDVYRHSQGQNSEHTVLYISKHMNQVYGNIGNTTESIHE